jgi:hypothetical protein
MAQPTRLTRSSAPLPQWRRDANIAHVESSATASRKACASSVARIVRENPVWQVLQTNLPAESPAPE